MEVSIRYSKWPLPTIHLKPSALLQAEMAAWGRIVNLPYLVSQNLISNPVLYLSKSIIEHKDDCYHVLAAVTQRGAWQGCIEYMLAAVLATSSQTNQEIAEILSQMEATFNYVKSKSKWYTQWLNQVLFSQPYIKQATIRQVTGV